MVHFKDFQDGKESYLCVVSDPKAKAEDAKHKFPVYPSLSWPDPKLSATVKKIPLPQEMTASLDKPRSRPTYILKSTLKDMEEESGVDRPFLFGREIIKGARWGPKILKFPGEFAYLPLYWEWTEEVIARCPARLKCANLYDAVYASLYSYDHDVNVLRAFCESWCPKTNTLHMEVGEGSPSLWDLEKLGGLSVSGHLYDEAIPNLAALNVRDKNGRRLIPRAFGHLLSAYCLLEDQCAPEEGVSATRWIQFWCRSRRETPYGPPPRRRSKDAKTRSRNTHNPSGEIPLVSLDWTSEEVEVFTQLQIADSSERKGAYLAAYLSCWLCVFALPEHESRLIRPATFEIAARMAAGERISMAVPVLASIYHGLSKLVTARKPAVSDSIFPAHYLYGWLAHYFNTHHDLPEALLGPPMVQCSGYGGARYHGAVEARDLIHSGAFFRAASLLLARSRCFTVCDDNKLDLPTMGYIISLRTAYLPLRSGACFYLEPYHPTRFARQYGFYQEVPGVLPRFSGDGTSFDVALKHVKTLLWKGSLTRVTLPGCLLSWVDFASPDFVSWWRAVSVTDLRANIQLLALSVTSQVTKKNVGVIASRLKAVGETLTIPVLQREAVVGPSGKRVRTSSDDDATRAKTKQCQPTDGKMRVYDDLFSAPLTSPERLVENIPPAPAMATLAALPVPVAASSSHGSSTASAALCAEEPFEGEATPASTISPAIQSRPIEKHSDFTRSMAETVKSIWLKKLVDTPYDQVEAFVAEADALFESVKLLGGDASSFRAKIDVYVGRVRTLLADDVADRAILEVERTLKSVCITLEDVRRDVKNREHQLSSLYGRRAELKALMQAVAEEETQLLLQTDRQLEEISILEPKVCDLEQKRAKLKASKIARHKELKRELDILKADFGACT